MGSDVGGRACSCNSLRDGGNGRRRERWATGLLALVLAAPLVTNAFGQDGAPERVAPRQQAADPVDRARAATSRHAYAHQAAGEALATARKRHPNAFRKPVGPVLRDERVLRRLDERAALVELGGRRMVATSSSPMTVAGAEVDLALVRDGDGFSSRNAPVATRAGGSLAEGVTFDDVDATVVPLGGAAGVAPKLVDGRLFWANAAVDTDVVVVPTIGGFESFVQLRSAASPETLSMPIELPAGSRLREQRDAFYAESSGRPVLRISRPTAVDAAGRPVELQAHVAGDGLVIVARHRGRTDVTYPVMVDPIVDANVAEGSDAGNWTFSGYPTEEWQGDTGDWGFSGLWIYGWPSGAVGSGSWSVRPPGDAYVHRFESPGAITGAEDFTNPCIEIGLYRDTTDTLIEGESACGHNAQIAPFVREPAERTPGRYSLRFTMSHPDYEAPYISGYSEGLTFYYSDDVAPTSDSATWPPGWTNGPITIGGRDSGVGVKSIAASTPDGPWTASGTHPCTGSSTAYYCPAVWTITPSSAGLPEGEVRVSRTVTDLVGRQSAPMTSVVKIDRSGPDVEVSWPAAEQEGAYVGAPSTLAVNATDGSNAGPLTKRSGVASVELLVDGASVDATMPGTQRVTQACPAGSCPLMTNLDFDPAGLAQGSHEAAVRGVDHAGNQWSALYIINVDTADPQITLSGGLAAAEGTTLEPGDYDLHIDATDDAGIEEIEVLVDGEPWDEAVPEAPPEGLARSATTNTDFTYDYTHRGDAFTPGDHEIEIRVKDKSGRWTSHKFPVKGNDKLSDTAGAIGFEEHFVQRSIATGAGSTASVNLASGNLAWHHRPIANAGRGLSTNVDITFNSRASDDDLGGGYDHIGEGFSLAISSLTRVNEPLDVRYVDKDHDKRNDVVTLTDADGTMHRFKRRMNGSTATDIFDPPPGVNLHLRKYYKNPATTDQKRKVWAATQADGTTHFFDACGYQRSVEDRNGNALTFTYEDEVCKHHSRTQRAKLESVTDAGGRSVRLFYGSWGSTKRVDYILDHANRKLDFRYTSSKRLEKIVENAGTSAERSFQFDYEDWGHKDKDLSKITDPLGRHTRIEYSDDHHGDHWHWPKYGLGERVVELTDRRGESMTFDYDVEPPYLETELTDRRGKLWRFRTDSQARLRELVDPLGTLTRYAWDADNNPSQIDEAVGTADLATTVMTWNANGRMLSRTDGEGRHTELVYRDHNGVHESPAGADAGGTFVSDLTKITTPKGVASAAVDDFATRYAYREPADPAGFEDRGNVRSQTDAEGFVTRWDYTPQGLVSRESAETDRGVFAVTTFAEFDPNGQPQLVTDPRNNQWRMRYDVLGRTTDLRDPRATHVPDPAVDAEDFTTEFRYDAYDRIVLRRTPKLSRPAAGETRQFIVDTSTYDANDNLLSRTDGNNAVTGFTYTPMDDVELLRSPAVAHEGEAAPASEETRLRYDGEQNVIERVLPKGTATTSVAGDHTTTVTYDGAGQRTVERRQADATGTRDLVTSRAYDRRGNVVGLVDPKENAKGGDPAANATLTARRRFTFGYDRANNQRFAIEDPGGLALRSEMVYDANDNLVAQIDPRAFQPNPTSSYRTTFEYDGRDMLVAKVDAEGGRTEYQFRGDGRMVRMTRPNGTASAAPGDFETRVEYFPTGDLRERTIPRADGQYGPGSLPWKVVYQRNEVGDPTTITDGRGRSLENRFFDTGHLKSTSRPSWWAYDGSGVNEAGEGAGRAGGSGDRETTQPGVAARGDFGSAFRQLHAGVMPRAGETSFTYDGAMRLTASRDVAGNVYEVQRDALGRAFETREPFAEGDKIVERYTFDRHGKVRALTDGAGHTMRMVYDPFDRLERQVAPGETVGGPTEDTVYGYDQNGNQISVQTPRGPQFTWRTTFDRIDRMTSQTNPAGEKTTFEDYDGAGNVRLHTRPRGNVAGLSAQERATFGIRRTFDALNRVTRVENGLGHRTNLAYDRDSNLVEVDAPGAKASASGDVQRRLTRISYDGRDLPWATTVGQGEHARTTIEEFDPNGNVRREITPTGTNLLDGRWVARWPDQGPDESRHATVHDYDADNLQIRLHQPWGAVTEDDRFSQNDNRYLQDFERDQRGRIIAVNAPHTASDTVTEEKVTRFTHFQNGWIKSARDPELTQGGTPYRQLIEYGYDKRGFQTLWRSDPRGRRVTRAFAPNGALDRRDAFRGPNDTTPRTYEYDYNANHTLVAMIDFDSERPSGHERRTTRTELDAAERQTLVNELWQRGRDTTFRYDADGNVTRRQTDGRFLPTAEDPDRYVDGRTTAMTYDPLDRETRTVVCRTPVASCTPADAGARVTTSEWFDSGDKSLTVKSNDVRETRFWFNDGRLAQLRRVTAGGSVEKDQTYTYDDNGNRTRDERGTHAFSPRDGLIRWTRTKAPAGTRVFYDLTGSGAIEREQDEAGPDTDYQYVGDRLDKAVISQSGVSVTADYRYDDFGSLTRINTPAGDTDYVFDEFHRLSTTKGKNVPPSVAGDRFCYDGLDRRDLRIEGGDGATCANPNAGSASSFEYSYVGLTERLSREVRSNGSVRTYDYDASYGRLGRSARESTEEPGYRSYATDANGTVEGLEAGNGNVAAADSYTYDPYGNQETRSGDPEGDPEAELSTEARDNPFRFEGFYFDRGAGGYDMQAREYLPDIRRFLTQDRFQDAAGDLALQGNPMTQNRYAFAGGNPVSNVEFDGHEPITSYNRAGRQPLRNKDGSVLRADPGAKAASESSYGPDPFYQRGGDDDEIEHPNWGAHPSDFQSQVNYHIRPTKYACQACPSPAALARRAARAKDGLLSGAAAAVEGTIHAVTHPVQTAEGIVWTVKNPKAAAQALLDSCDGHSIQWCIGYAGTSLAGAKGSTAVLKAMRGSSGGHVDATDDAPDATTIPDPAARRPKLREPTKQAVKDAQAKTPEGDFIDPNTFQVIPKEGPFHFGHIPGFEWWRTRDRARAEGWSRQEVIEYENDPSHFQIEDPASNMSHRHEMPR